MGSDIRENLTHHFELMGQGRVLEGFELYYHPDVVMSENGDVDPNRQNKEANRQYETYFANNAQWHDMKVGNVIVDQANNTSAYEMFMDFTFQGQRIARTQAAVQEWKDGQIIKETFYYKTN